VAGPVVGAILIIGINEVAIRQMGESAINIVFTGLILVVTLLFFPEGIVGTWANRADYPPSSTGTSAFLMHWSRYTGSGTIGMR